MSWQDTLASVPSVWRHGILGYMDEAFRRKGEVASANFGPFPAVFVSRPDLIRHVLVTHKDSYAKENPIFDLLRPLAGNGVFLSDGEFWRSQRRILQPEFTMRGVDSLLEGMVRVAAGVALEWDVARRSGQFVDAGASMRSAAIRVICQTVLNVDVGAVAPSLERALDRLLSLFQLQMSVPARIAYPLSRTIERPMQEAVATIDEFVAAVVEQNRATSTAGVVHRLMAAPDPETGRTMSPKQLRDEIVTLFIAGHETTATTLTWAWLELSRHPHAMARLREEADSVLGQRALQAEDLERLPYARAVFEECMRLYPPLPFLPRFAKVDDVLDGRHVPAGTTIVASIYALHRRPDLWTAPATFDPTRFLPERRKNLDPGAFAPFGAGPRLCMGNHFALAEGVVLLTTLVRRFEIARAGNEEVGITRLPGSLRPDRPVRLRLSPRIESRPSD